MDNYEGKKLSLMEHLRELRQRLIKSVIAVGIATILSFAFADQIFQILIRPAGGANLIAIEITENFSTYLKVCLMSGLILSMPFITYQFLRFVSPGLTSKEKRTIYLVLPWIGLMFAGGVVFAYRILLPPAMDFLFKFGSEFATPQIRIGNYISIVTRLLLAIGLTFELPVVTTLLARLGIVTSKWLAQRRKIAIMGTFVVAAVITPTADPINQSLVAVPLILLYEMGIWLAKVAQKRRAAAKVKVPASAEPITPE